MKKLAVLFFFLSLSVAQADTIYSYSQTANFNSSNFGVNRTVNTGIPDSSYTYSFNANFDKNPPTTHQSMTYTRTHPYHPHHHYFIRRWDDPRLPFEADNDLYQKRCLPLGYFFKPGQKVCVYPGCKTW
jgi:hypothetical protein